MTFDEVFDRVIGHEGGYTFNPSDPGGETNWGISKRSYPRLIIKELTREQAKEIYNNDFWDRIRTFTSSDSIAFQLFDFAVNSGISTAIRYLQRAVGVADDGFWGPVSSNALNAMSETDIIMRLNSERLDFMTRLSTWSVFGKGWARRIAQNLKFGSLDS